MLHNKLKSQYVLLNANSDSNAALKRASLIPPGHNIKGTLIAHLHEHKSSVTKLTALSSTSSLFASASTDGTVRLFDCNKLNGHQSINKWVSIPSAPLSIYMPILFFVIVIANLSEKMNYLVEYNEKRRRKINQILLYTKKKGESNFRNRSTNRIFDISS